ncbi:MAG: glycosyltransferase family 117 protein [Gemmatimonadales bacterium]
MTNAADSVTPRPPYYWAAAVVVGTLALYVATLAPTVQFWDASEYITAAHALGIPHPPGNPLFVLLAHVWGLLPLAGDYGARINLFAAATSAASAALWFLIGERWLLPIVPPALPRRLAALAGALVGATAFTVWNQSVVNEKVYTISVLSITLALWLAMRWADHPPAARPDRWLALIAYLFVLTSANHQMGLLAVPAVLVLIVTTDVRVLVRPRVLALVAGAAVLALTAYLFLPIRAHLDPYLNQGAVDTWPALVDHLTRAQFGKPSVVARQADFVSQLGLWVQYFTWQWGRDLPDRFAGALAWGFAFLGLLGGWRHWRAERRQAAVMTTLLVTVTLALVIYLNFKYGFSQYPDRQLPREVRERDYFFIASFSAWGVWVGMGLATLAEWVVDAQRRRRIAPAWRWAVALPVFALALIPLATNHRSASRSGETLARDFGHDLLQSVDPYALVVTAGDNDTFPLWYAQEVGGVRRDVTVLVTSLGNLNWYLRQMNQRPIAPFDSAGAPAMHRERAWPKPAEPWLAGLYRGTTDTLPEYTPLHAPVAGRLGPISVALDPAQLPTPGLLTRVDLALLQIIKEQLGRRPIYFANSVGTYPDQLGLGAHLVTEGMVRRLLPTSVVPSDSVRLSDVQGRYVHVPRTTRLAFEVYHGAEAARARPKGWVDRASQNVLLPYLVTYDTIAELVRDSDPARSRAALALALAIQANTTYRFNLVPPEPSR